ncbi:ATP-dependent helicase rhp16 isoform X2 [Vigna angularis]|uniref:ATP-dependent helicase rhp16 isoform X2 n=1 Tax=Phaseolus angularis TaxID=3914 RepID=UPI000809A21E|nr:ATP-dependent helicase rhp16 isoform X2 [Vigna angularis]
MELRSRRRLSNPAVSGNEQQPKDDTVVEDETKGQSSNNKDKGVSVMLSDSDVVSGSDSDSDYEDEELVGGSLLDLNKYPFSSISVSDGEDYGSDSSDGDILLFKKAKVPGSRARRKSMNTEKGEPSDVVRVVDREYSMISPVLVPSAFKGTKKRKYTKKGSKGDSRPVLLWNAWEEEQEKWIDQHIAEDFDLDNQSEVMNETAEAPSDLTMPLLRYQREWLAWALKQEHSSSRGGILADEMGMGKTIQAIALVLAKREFQDSCEPDQSIPCSSNLLPAIKGTLVICPVVAVTQWVSEIDRFTLKGSTKVLVYHGANRGRSVDRFADYDFVITTYSVVENEYRKHMMPPKERCPYCGKLFLPSKLMYHQSYFCGPDAVRTEKQSKQAKKKREVTKGKTKECESSKILKGSIKKKGDKMCIDMEDSDAVPVRSDRSFLHAVKWQRIILDEAHYIKSRHCNTAKAVLALDSTYKWALSGTPLQNRVGELYSLIRFLQITPYSYYLCKDCDCRILDHSSKECSVCTHSSVRHFCWWNKYVATPIQSFGNGDSGKRAMILLKHKVLKNIVLRRTKIGRAADLALPPRIVSLRKDCLDIKEQDYYESLYNESQAQFNTYIEANTLMHNYAHIFDLLTRLRQAVDHPYLVVYSQSSGSRSAVMANNATTVEQICGICHEPVEDLVVTSCEHSFCRACLIDYYSTSLGQVSCPACSKLLTVDLTSNKDPGDQVKTTIKGFRSSSILNRIRLENFQTSTKIEALREEIRFMVERDGSAKGIVFSQFTSFLDLINYSLHKSGVSCVQLNGSMSLNARDAAIRRFTEDPDCKIFLMSLKAGGVALNLTVASHVFLMDPWWNPAVERQAQDRIHRIGQYKPIRIVRFVIENTIEERILKLQEKKELVFEGTIGGSSDALGKLTEADLRFLFVT